MEVPVNTEVTRDLLLPIWKLFERHKGCEFSLRLGATLQVIN